MIKRLAAFAVLAFPMAAFAAYSFDVTIVGAKTDFVGESGSPAHTVKGLDLTYSLIGAYDPATGLVTGRRQHSPVVFVKRWDAATPQILTALSNGELLSKVVFTFYSGNAHDYSHPLMRITLSNARVVSDKLHAREVEPVTWQGEAPQGTIYSAHELEEVSVIFQKILVENPDGGTAFVDSWSTAFAMVTAAEAAAAAAPAVDQKPTSTGAATASRPATPASKPTPNPQSSGK
jgi:type VI secretion system secreted protein Hcp